MWRQAPQTKTVPSAGSMARACFLLKPAAWAAVWMDSKAILLLAELPGFRYAERREPLRRFADGFRGLLGQERPAELSLNF
jgi:hypothetical protein